MKLKTVDMNRERFNLNNTGRGVSNMDDSFAVNSHIKLTPYTHAQKNIFKNQPVEQVYLDEEQLRYRHQSNIFNNERLRDMKKTVNSMVNPMQMEEGYPNGFNYGNKYIEADRQVFDQRYINSDVGIANVLYNSEMEKEKLKMGFERKIHEQETEIRQLKEEKVKIEIKLDLVEKINKEKDIELKRLKTEKTQDISTAYESQNNQLKMKLEYDQKLKEKDDKIEELVKKLKKLELDKKAMSKVIREYIVPGRE